MRSLFTGALVVCAALTWGTARLDGSPQAADLPTLWRFAGLAAGSVTGPPDGSILMPDVIQLPDGRYRLYFNHSRGAGKEVIAYSESTDGVTWERKGDVIAGATDPADPFYIVGGPRVLRLPDGRYRMYVRACPAHAQGQPPRYKTFSYISPDGLQFTKEDGVRVDISPDDPSSPITLAGHGTYFQIADGSYVGILSANPIGVGGASDLFIGRSSDGLAWRDFRKLYNDFHDPIVIKRGDRYYLIAMLLDQASYYGASMDGLTWPSQDALVKLTFAGGSNADVTAHVGDTGAMIAPNAQLWILANWGPNQEKGGISTAVAIFKPDEAAPTDCAFTVTPTSRAFSAAGGFDTIAVTASRDDCPRCLPDRRDRDRRRRGSCRRWRGRPTDHLGRRSTSSGRPLPGAPV